MSSPDRTTPPALSEFGPLKLPEFSTTELPNGIKVHSYCAGDEDVIQVIIIWPVGSSDINLPGVTSFMTAMLTEGTEKHSGREISDIVEGNGAWTKFGINDHDIVMTVKLINHTASEIFPLLAEIIQSPTFPAETVESIRQKRASDLEIYLQRPLAQADRLALQTYFGPRTPRCPDTTPDDILAISRDILADTHRRTILSNLPQIIITGKITPDIMQQLAATLGNISFHTDNPDRITRRLLPMPEIEGTTTLRHEMPESLQTNVRYLIPALPPTHPDIHNLTIATVALGGYFGSRLMKNIREDKGYTYGIYCFIFPTEDAYQTLIACECDNRFADDVINEVNKEIERLATEPMGIDELEEVRNVFVSDMANSLDTHIAVGSTLSGLLTTSLRPEAFDRRYEAARQMTPEKLMDTARRYLLEQPKIIALAGGNPDGE